MLLFILVLAVAQAKTVRYSNVPPRAAIATKTYDLEVPGSAPIRIIEAEPIWSADVTTPVSQENEKRVHKEKTGKHYFTTQATQSTISEPVTHEPESSNSYSPEALNSFLKDYTQKLKNSRNKFNSHNDEESSEEPINKLASIYLDRMDDPEKFKSWGQIDTKRHKHPYDDKKGWVTLEAIPWSTSKISKWQSNNKNEPKPWEVNRPQSNWNTKYTNNPHKNQYLDNNDYNGNPNSFSNNFNDNDYNNGFEDNNDNIFNDKPVANIDIDIRPTFNERPQYSKPMYSSDTRPIKVKPNLSDWPIEIPSKPSWNSRPSSQNAPQNQWNNNPVPNPWLDRNPVPVPTYGVQGYKDDSRDIITDGRPGDFPKTIRPTFEPVQEQPALTATNSHPINHPMNGNGEWVLVSTTKGYQYPRNKRQRSIEVTPDSIGTRRGIRLTVLPPSNNTNINMTTSHGGILEVESTFETVEESRNKYVITSAENVHQHPNNTRIKVHKNIKKPIKSQVVVTTKPKPVNSVPYAQRRPTLSTMKKVNPVAANSNTQDATAVLAAVGAGMVPATMAMLVPFVTGRKKRNTNNNLWQKINIDDVPVYL